MRMGSAVAEGLTGKRRCFIASTHNNAQSAAASLQHLLLQRAGSADVVLSGERHGQPEPSRMDVGWASPSAHPTLLTRSARCIS